MRFVATVPGAIAKLYLPAAFVDVRATGLNPCWLGNWRHNTTEMPQRWTPLRTPTSRPNTVSCLVAVTGFGVV